VSDIPTIETPGFTMTFGNRPRALAGANED
jgi:hypothetical protein